MAPMSLPMCSRTIAIVLALAIGVPALAAAQNFTPLGTEYSVSGNLPGDQTHSSVSLSQSGGYLVWQDNAVDGAGLGIAAQKLDGNFSGFYGYFRVNQQSSGNQEHPQVAMLAGGGAGIVWQGGKLGRQNIYVRFLTSTGTFSSSSDVRVNTFTNTAQTFPALAALPDGNAAVAWTSRDQDGSMDGIYGRIVSPSGQNLGSPFGVNQYTAYSQRNPAIAVLTGGNFVVVWISENQGLTLAEINKGAAGAHVYGRLFSHSGQPLGNEFRINTDASFCDTPVVAASSDGGFVVAWAEKHQKPTSWEIVARNLDASGSSSNNAFHVNTTTFGDQYAPRITAAGANQILVWTSLGQDGSREGVFGRVLSLGQPVGPEFQINTTTLNRQVYPAVASDGGNRFLVVWSSFGSTSFDLYGQRFAAGQGVPQPFAPWVTSLSQSDLLVSWPELSGYSVAGYEVYKDGATSPSITTSANYWKAPGLAPASIHTFRIAYRMVGGQRSNLSAPATGATWGADENADGLPDDWQQRYWPDLNALTYPHANVDSDGDGVSNYLELLAGTDPTDPQSVLKVRMEPSPEGAILSWSTQPGSIYQLQVTTDFKTWSNFGSARFAAGLTDSLVVGGAQGAANYRVVRVL
jgi:hypothetical protein